MEWIRKQKSFIRLSDRFIHSFNQSVNKLLLSHSPGTVLDSKNIKNKYFLYFQKTRKEKLYSSLLPKSTHQNASEI